MSALSVIPSVESCYPHGQAQLLLNAMWRSQAKSHFICTLDKATSKFRNIPVASHEEAINFALAYSAAGLDTYFGIAEYVSPTSRVSLNAFGAWSFIADIDVGHDKAAAGKGYATVEEARQAICDFCAKTGLPESTTINNSGAGLHVFWAFDQFLEREEWLAYATKLKALMKICGFHADPSRTADIASVLRVPGTLNYKYAPPRSVTVLCAYDECIDLAAMLDAIDAAVVTFAVDTTTSGATDASQSSAMTPVPFQVNFDREPPNLLTLASALKTLNPDCDERTWKFHRIAPMAYEARYFTELHDALYKLARDWSSGDLRGVTSVKWNTPGGNGQSGKQSFDRVWKRFINDKYNGKRASLGTIYYHAQQEGWVFPIGDDVGDATEEGGNG